MQALETIVLQRCIIFIFLLMQQ